MSGTLRQGSDVVHVRLVGFPLELYATAQEHHDELLREFVHISNSSPDTATRIPGRLLALVEDLRGRYGPFTERAGEQIEEARAGGRSTVDVDYQVPRAAGDAASELAARLDEADEFCRQGHLLTLAAPADLLAFRRWFLGEFSRQVAGQPPRPWSPEKLQAGKTPPHRRA